MPDNTANSKLRRQVWPDRGSKEQAGDIQIALDRTQLTVLRTLESFYTEPLAIGQLTREPAGIELLRIISLVTPEQAVICSSNCSWVWKPQLGGARILSINGLAPSTTIKYRMTFRLTFGAD